MSKLKLVKSRSYNGYGIKATNLKPPVEVADEAIASKLIGSGYFVAVAGPAPVVPPVVPPVTPPTGEGDIEKMTEKQLDAYAEENGIDLAGLTKKADKLAKIQQALADCGADLDFSENE
jgi:hypothetical protein